MLLLISGHNRSGTTLTQRLCDSHPSIAMTNEFGAFFDLHADAVTYRRQILRRWWTAKNRPFFTEARRWIKWQPYNKKSIGIQNDNSYAGTANKLLRINMLQNLYFVTRYLLKIKRDGWEYADTSAIEAAFQVISPNAQVVGDNHPDYIYGLNRFAEIDGLHCIIVYRDPRDVVSAALRNIRPHWLGNEVDFGRSKLKRWWREELGTAKGIANRWVKATRLMEHQADKIFTIRYEDLVTNPQPVLGALGHWLEVDPERFNYEMIHIGGNMGEFRRGLSDQELQDIIQIAGPTMERLGYEL